MRFPLNLLAAGTTLIFAEANAGWTGGFFVEKITSVIASESAIGNPVIEICEVSLSNGRTYAFRIEGPKQISWIDFLSAAMGQKQRVEIYTPQQPESLLNYRPRVCAHNGESYTCGFLKDPVSMPPVAGVSLEGTESRKRFNIGFGAGDPLR